MNEIRLFDGRTLAGWKASESPSSWSVSDGSLVARGRPRSHLYYVGPGAPFRDFVLEMEVYTAPRSNGGVYILTQFQPRDWPRAGYEVQVNNTHADPAKTGSLYGVLAVRRSSARDGVWWTQRITVEGPRIRVYVEGKLVLHYVEDARRIPPPGTVALQAHDPNSVVRYRDIRLRRLP